MKIIKYKKGNNGKYKVLLEDGREISFYEDVILKFNFLITKNIGEKDIEDALDYNQECDVYHVALKSIKSRFRSIYELKSFLLHKQYPEYLINKAIQKLENQGYLNDRNFAKSYISSQMLTTSKGPFKIERELLEKKVLPEIVDKEIQIFTIDEQKKKIDKLIQKSIKLNHSIGGVVLMKKIYNKIKGLGYDSSLIRSNLSNYSFGHNSDIAKKEYDKLYRRYSSRYEGENLKRIIREKMFLKGLSYEEND